jgi:hypothetical protein
MSKSKFNLSTYQKINGNEHIDMRLNKSREEAPDVINEKQLEDYRSKESDVLVEKLLEKNREGGADETTEKRLDTHKAKFANKYRNPEAYEGDMNKLEEQRLSGDPVEKEKYESASSTPKQLRWWEGVKSEDGLKLAKEDKAIKVAQALPTYEMEPGTEGLIDEESTITPPEETIEDFPIDDMSEETNTSEIKNMEIIKEAMLPNSSPDMSAIYMVLSYDPMAFDGDEMAIKASALSTILSVRPELANLIDENDLEVIEGVDKGTVKLKVFGAEFANVIEQIELKKK